MDQIDKTTNSITALSAKGFGALCFNERAHLQEWIAKCPECLGGELLIIAKEFDVYDPEHWPEMIGWLAEHVKCPEKAFGMRLKVLGPKLKAEFNSNGAFQEVVER